MKIDQAVRKLQDVFDTYLHEPKTADDVDKLLNELTHLTSGWVTQHNLNFHIDVKSVDNCAFCGTVVIKNTSLNKNARCKPYLLWVEDPVDNTANAGSAFDNAMGIIE